MKQKITTDRAPDSSGPVPLSQGIESNNFVFTSGQIPRLPDGTMTKGTVAEKTHQVMKNLEAILKAADLSFDNVVKATVYVTDLSIAPELNEVYMSYFSEPLPAREMVCVKALPLGAEIEISLIAVRK